MSLVLLAAGSISSQFLHGQLLYLHHHMELKGIDSRCLANLIWALAKLDLSTDDQALTTELALNVAPFVIRSLGSSSPQVLAHSRYVKSTCSGLCCLSVATIVGNSMMPLSVVYPCTDIVPSLLMQGLANILWGYAKLPVSPVEVVAALVQKITEELQHSWNRDGCKPFDAQVRMMPFMHVKYLCTGNEVTVCAALWGCSFHICLSGMFVVLLQALSNSIWALAHLKSRGVDLDAMGCAPLKFLEALAQTASHMLVRLQQQQSFRHVPSSVQDCVRFLGNAEAEFSCQALVNIAWSFATLVGATCATHAPIHQLFTLIHTESINR